MRLLETSQHQLAGGRLMNERSRVKSTGRVLALFESLRGDETLDFAPIMAAPEASRDASATQEGRMND